MEDEVYEADRDAVWQCHHPGQDLAFDAYGYLIARTAPEGTPLAWEADHIFPKKHLETIGVDPKGIDHPDNLWPMGMRRHPNPVKSNVLMPRGRHQRNDSYLFETAQSLAVATFGFVQKWLDYPLRMGTLAAGKRRAGMSTQGMDGGRIHAINNFPVT